MASFLHRTNPWIESTFLYASSFDPDTFQEQQYYREPPEEEKEDDKEEVRTNDTIPSGLLSSSQPIHDPPPSNNGASSSSPPSRRGKIVQVMHVGGDLDYYEDNRRRDHRDHRQRGPISTGSTANDNDRSDDHNISLPPHLVVHDGIHSAIAFLSPETCRAYIEDNSPLPCRRSLIGISRYTVSTILQCCRRLEDDEDDDVDVDARMDDPRHSAAVDVDESLDATLPLPDEMQAEVDDAESRRRKRRGSSSSSMDLEAHATMLSSLLFTDVPIRRRRRRNRSTDVHPPPRPHPAFVARYQLIPTELQVQLMSQVPDTRLYMCLYIQGRVSCIGAENGGLIGDPVDVHCSVSLRRALMRHRRLYGDDNSYDDDNDDADVDDDADGEVEGYSHSVLIRRLEAVHCYYYWLDRQRLRDSTFGNDDDDDDIDRDDDYDDDGEERRSRRGGVARATKKQYGRRNRGKPGGGGRGGGRDGGRDGAGRRDNVDGDNDKKKDRRHAPSSSDSMDDLIPEWPWESRLTAIESTRRPPLDDERDDAIVRGDGNATEGGNGDGGGGGDVDGTIDDNDINGASSVDVERHDAHDEAAEATDNRTDGEVTSTAATAVAVSSLHSRNQIGDVNELFNLTEDIDDILGLDDDFESSIATANVFEVNNATGGTAENMSSSARENEEHENEIYDLDGRGEIHEEIDDAPTFVGIDGMIVDDEDDSDNGENEGGGDSDYLDTNYEPDVDTQGVLTQPPDVEGAAYGYLDGDGSDTDEEAMATADYNPESQIILPSYPLERTSKKRMNKEQSVDDFPDTNYEPDVETQGVLTQQQDTEGAAHGHLDCDGSDSDEEAMATADYNPESQIILPSYPVGRTSKNRINKEQWADEQESEVEMDPKISKSIKKAAARPMQRNYDSDEDLWGSQIPIHLRKAPPETLALASTATTVHRSEERMEESQIPFPVRKARIEPWRPTVEEVGDDEVGEEVLREQESQIPLGRKLSKKPTGNNEHPQRVVKKSRAAPSSSRKHHDDSDDSSDEWMKVRRREPASRSRSVAPPPKRAKAHSAAAAPAAKANDESTEFFFESQVAGEGSEESMPPPPPLPPMVSSPRNQPSTETTTYLRGDDTDDDGEEEGIREKIHGAPPISTKNQSTAHNGGNVGGSDNYRVRSDMANFDMSFISTKASIILGLSSSSTSITSLGRQQDPDDSQSSNVETGQHVADNDVAHNKRRRTAKQFDIVHVLERARGLSGI